MIEFQGKIDTVIFESDTSFFKIIDVLIESKIAGWETDHITVTGNFGEIVIDASYDFKGMLVNHEKYGQQFRVEQYQIIMPHEEASIIKYLSSDQFPGIGEKTAKNIVNSLGVDAIDKIKANVDIVDKLKLSTKQKAVLKSEISAMDNFSEVILELTKLGLSKRLATLMYQKYQGEILPKIKDNPYTLISAISGYGFKTADQIGYSLNFSFDNPKRLQGALLQILQDNYINEGNTFVYNHDLLTWSSELINGNAQANQQINFDQLATQLNNLQKEELVLVEDDKAFLTSAYKTEWDIAQQLLLLSKRKIAQEKLTKQEINVLIKKVEQNLDITYDQTQKDAIAKALVNPIFLLTGGPGTGKTTIISGILLALRFLNDYSEQELKPNDSPFLLAAPTGRAAKRIQESTGLEAKTIHRLLGIGREGNYDLEELNELNGEVLIIDEMSMVDMKLFKTLIKAVNQTKHLIFVGDRDQLPSVGPGNIFADLINSKIFPTTILQQIHRQSGESSIIDLAYDINLGQDNSFNKKTANTSFISCTPSQIQAVVPQVVERALTKGFKKDDLQVLGAMYKTDSGIEHLNEILQSQLNPPKEDSQKVVEHNNQTFRIGDRVLQLVNNPEKDIYNGQIGKVIGINLKDTSKLLTVDFDGHEVNISRVELNDLTLAYAITIHKSQGSEFKLVILTLTMQNYRMLRRNLLYTAVTRAKEFLIMVGDIKAFKLAIKTPGNDRNTAIIKRLHELFKITENQVRTDEKKSGDISLEESESAQFVLTQEMIINHEIDPLIGVQNYEFKKSQ